MGACRMWLHIGKSATVIQWCEEPLLATDRFHSHPSKLSANLPIPNAGASRNGNERFPSQELSLIALNPIPHFSSLDTLSGAIPTFTAMLGSQIRPTLLVVDV